MESFNNSIIQYDGSSKILTGGEDIADPSTISYLKFWLEGRYVYLKDIALPANNTAIGASGSTEWKDLTSNAYLVTNTTAANRPLFKTVDNSLAFDGSNDTFAVVSGLPIVGNGMRVLELFIKCKIASTTQKSLFLIGGSGNARIYLFISTTLLGVNTNRASGLPINSINLAGNYSIYNSIYVGVDWTANIMRVIVNGSVTEVALTNGSASTTSGANPSIASFNNSDWCNCNIQSIFYCEKASGNIMTISEADKYINYLNLYK